MKLFLLWKSKQRKKNQNFFKEKCKNQIEIWVLEVFDDELEILIKVGVSYTVRKSMQRDLSKTVSSVSKNEKTSAVIYIENKLCKIMRNDHYTLFTISLPWGSSISVIWIYSTIIKKYHKIFSKSIIHNP